MSEGIGKPTLASGSGTGLVGIGGMSREYHEVQDSAVDASAHSAESQLLEEQLEEELARETLRGNGWEYIVSSGIRPVKRSPTVMLSKATRRS